MSKPADLGSIKEGSYIVLDDEPCRVVQVDKSKPGKHGSAKVRLVAIGVFSNSKRSYVGPASSRVEVPIIEKRSGQVLAVTPSMIQVMDLETYETIEIETIEEEIRDKIQPGVEVEYWKVLGKAKITRVKG